MVNIVNTAYTVIRVQQFKHFSYAIAVVMMPVININQKNDFINVISTHGIQVEVDVDTLARWNDAIGKWWEVQLEMDKVIKNQND